MSRVAAWLCHGWCVPRPAKDRDVLPVCNVYRQLLLRRPFNPEVRLTLDWVQELGELEVQGLVHAVAHLHCRSDGGGIGRRDAEPGPHLHHDVLGALFVSLVGVLFKDCEVVRPWALAALDEDGEERRELRVRVSAVVDV